MPTYIHRVPGLTSWRWVGILLIWLATSLPFLFLYLTSQRVVIEEIRHHVMGVAIAAAAALDAEKLQEIRTTNDVAKPVYKATQVMLDRIAGANEDIRYIYTMRRGDRPFTPVTAYEYIVDQAARDDNHDGVFDRDELSEPPGTPYDASSFPEMVAAWEDPTADKHVTADPPYPDVISGYAPIRDNDGVTRAIVGVDVTAATLQRKLVALQTVVVVVWLVIGTLVTLVVRLYYQQRDAFDRIKRLNEELESRNEMLRVANHDLARHLAPQASGVHREPRELYRKSDLHCAAYGGDLCEVLELDQDHVAFYLAHVTGSEVGSALVAGLLKMAMASVRERSDVAGSLYVDLASPSRVLATLNDMLVREMPKGEYVTCTFAVVDLADRKLTLASAQQPSPVRYSSKAGRYEIWNVIPGPALGLAADQRYGETEKAVAEGDHLVICTESLLELKNSSGDSFGGDQFLATIEAAGRLAPAEFLAKMVGAAETFCGSKSVRDRFALLSVQFK